MSRYKIRLEMGKNVDYPDGDSQCGYEFEAPLSVTGALDPSEWKRNPDGYPVRRFWRDESSVVGHLIYTSRGSWRFHYGEFGEADEVAFQFNRKSFFDNDCFSVREHASEMRVFRAVAVTRMADRGPEDTALAGEAPEAVSGV